MLPEDRVWNASSWPRTADLPSRSSDTIQRWLQKCPCTQNEKSVSIPSEVAKRDNRWRSLCPSLSAAHWPTHFRQWLTCCSHICRGMVSDNSPGHCAPNRRVPSWTTERLCSSPNSRTSTWLPWHTMTGSGLSQRKQKRKGIEVKKTNVKIKGITVRDGKGQYLIGKSIRRTRTRGGGGERNRTQRVRWEKPRLGFFLSSSARLLRANRKKAERRMTGQRVAE